MRTCPTCHRLYPDDGGFCPTDGERLLPTAEAPLPEDAQDKRVGKTVCGGRYRIYRVVADGGMGRVYQALELPDVRSVALKILHPEVADDAVAVERFKREFECSASLPHDHIVDVLAFEQTEDESFALVMEYLEGEELRALLKRVKVLPPERLVRMLSQLAIGLGSAHERSVVHRDLKPDNIFLCGTHDGDIVKILDFGSVRDNSAGAKKLTMFGTTIGSPYYMAPEQAQGLPTLDQRADVWSLAAISYEVLSGKVPFDGTTGPSILLAILTREPAPLSEAGREQGIPVALDAVIEAALTKDPAIRVASAAALADQVGHALGLPGSHLTWATTPQADLGRLIASAPRLAPPTPSLSGMDAAFATAKTDASAYGAPRFSEDIVMGVPAARPGWVAPVLAGLVLLGAALAFFLAR